MSALRFARKAGLLLAAALALAVPASAQESDDSPVVYPYEVFYDALLVPSEGTVAVTIRLGKGAKWVSWIRFSIDPERHLGFVGDGKVTTEGRHVRWEPPEAGGELRYHFRIDQSRNRKAYDARLTSKWAIFRGDDLVPPARVRSEVGSHAIARLRMRLPEGWSACLPYDLLPDGTYRIDHAKRRFDRPTGWFALGRLTVLREKIAGVRVAVAGPTGQDFRRQDVLALLRWTLPTLRKIVADLPPRLVVVGAGDPMWRGGLSGPRSVYLHADRPLISNDVTSPLLHELMHAVLGIRPGDGGDWIVEGLAEYYSLELLVRSRTISRSRHRRALARIAERGRDVAAIDGEESKGDVTARAVSVLAELDAELERRTEGEASLDQVLARLAAERGAVDAASLQSTAESVVDGSLTTFFRTQVPLADRR